MTVLAKYDAQRVATTAFIAVVLAALVFGGLARSQLEAVDYIFTTRPLTWPLLLAAYLGAGWFVVFALRTLFQVAFRSSAALWVEDGNIRTLLWSVQRDEIDAVEFFPGRGLFNPPSLKFLFKSSGPKTLPTALLSGNGEDLVASVRAALRC